MSDPKTLFTALFEPSRIALIGASADEKKTTSRPQRFLRKHGFSGEILPVNPSRSEILGERAYKDLDAIAGDIDHAYILLNGKEVDLAVGEIADLMVDDPKTNAIVLFMETLRDGERLAHAARRAHAAGKPVIAYKLGRSEIGQELAKSHTGAIAGSDATFDAFCRRHGIARVSMFESLVDVPALLVDRPPARGKRVVVATTTGGGAAMVVDNMAMARLDIADPPQALVDWLKPLGLAAGDGKLIDLTLAGAKPEIVAGTIERLLADDGNDAAIFVVGSSAQFNPELAVEPLLKFAKSAKPFAVSLTPSAEKSLALLTAAGVPALRHPEACAEAMALCLLRPVPQPVPILAEPTSASLEALAAGRVSGFDERRRAARLAAPGGPVAWAVAVPAPHPTAGAR